MRRHIAVVAAMMLGACGGGYDVTSPPSGEGVSLTVTAEGSGAGQVRTSSGTQPAIDCSLSAGGQMTGTCSANYPEGTAVNLTVAPAENSSFDGWAEDASDCGTQLSCSVTMTSSKTVVARLSSTSAAVEVLSFAYYPEADFGPEGAVIWVAEVRNNSAQTIESATINFTSHDAAGAVLASDFTFVGPIPPGETRAGQNFATYFGTEASVDVQVGEVIIATEDPNLGAAQIVSSNWQVDPDFGAGAIDWMVEVENTSTVELETVQVDFSTYDADGKILAYDVTLVGPIPPGERVSAESFADLHGDEANAKFQIASVRTAESPAALVRRKD
jgi:hypothetical protein